MRYYYLNERFFASEPITGERKSGVDNPPPVAMAAIVIGSLIGVALLVVIALVGWYKRRKKVNGEWNYTVSCFSKMNIIIKLQVASWRWYVVWKGYILYDLVFTHAVKVTYFVGGAFDLFNVLNVMCEQHHRNVFNLFLIVKKTGDFNGQCIWPVSLVLIYHQKSPFFLPVKSARIHMSVVLFTRKSSAVWRKRLAKGTDFFSFSSSLPNAAAYWASYTRSWK